MDQRSDQRGPGGHVTPQKVGQNGQFCNRTGYNGRTKTSQSARIGSSDKAKCSSPSFRAPIGNKESRKSSGSSSVMMTSAKKPDTREPMSSRSSRKISNHQYSPSIPSASKSSGIGSFNRFNGDGLRNLKCNSISDVVPVGKRMMKRGSLEGESSSSRRERKTTNESAVDSVPVSTRRSMSVNTRVGLANRQNGRNGSSVRGPAVTISETRDSELSFVSSRNGENPSDTMAFDSDEAGFTHLVNDGMSRGYDMRGIAEMLLALERIEQEEELTQRGLLALETSLFLGSLNLYDRHHGMRMDIDSMSYEELLALEERMGTVSTALSEDALSKCLRRSVYQAIPSKVQIAESCEDGYDIKCSICQEEYVTGDEIGKLVACQHGYHIRCINHWLQLKNWCPICKTSADPSQTSSSL